MDMDVEREEVLGSGRTRAVAALWLLHVLELLLRPNDETGATHPRARGHDEVERKRGRLEHR